MTLTDDPEINNNQEGTEGPVSEPEQELSPEEKAAMSGLRQDLATEEAEKNLQPVKTGFFRRVTGFLHAKTAGLRKTGSLPPAAAKETSLPVNAGPAVVPAFSETGAVEPGLLQDEMAASTEGSPLEGEPEGNSQPESSIFDLLYQVRQSGLGETPDFSPLRPETVGDTKRVTRSLDETVLPPAPVMTSPAASKEQSALPPPPDQIMTTSSLAARLWGLEEEQAEEADEPQTVAEKLSSDEMGYPFATETSDEGQPNVEDTDEKRGFFDRLKTSRSDDKTTRPLEIDDNVFINRVNRMTGELHEPTERIRPTRTDREGSAQSGQESDEEVDRFVFYPQEPEEGSPLPGSEAGNPADPSPFVSDKQESEIPSADGQEKEPFTVPSDEWAPREEPEKSFNLDEFLASQLGGSEPVDQAASTTASVTGEATTESGSTFEHMDFSAWGGAYPDLKETEASPDDEGITSDDSLEKIRAIALGSYQEEAAAPVEGASIETDQTAENPSESIEEMVVAPQPRKSWWSGLPVFERVLMISVGVLLVAAGAIAYLSANNFWQRAPAAIIQPTITPSTLPAPVKIILPGAWSFNLTTSAVAVTPDTPGTGIWLMGSEVRRVVELPWNLQTEAVIQTFTPGNLIQVLFDDDTVLNYKVDTVSRVSVNDTSVLTDNKPSLLIILAGEKDPERWVVVARP